MPADFDNDKQFLEIFKEIDSLETFSWENLRKILNRYPKNSNSFYSKDELIGAYRQLKINNPTSLPKDPDFLDKIKMKPTRTISGVATVTVLTKPFPCPGQCIFCPSDIRMPKSYLSDEPGAQRAERNYFDPYLQTFRRLKALWSIGHQVDKVEIIILGGTWSFYPEEYQIWFIKRIFEALNDFGEKLDQTEELEAEIKKLKPLIPNKYNKNYLNRQNITQATKGSFLEKAEKISQKSGSVYNLAVTEIIRTSRGSLIEKAESASWEDLEYEQNRNETAESKCVGLVIETRPDKISPKEVIRIRRLGCTKTQIGFQSLNDNVLKLNKRGHTVAKTAYAIKLLRLAGFKIHAHWMPNLYGSTPKKDIKDYQKMFESPRFRPDELKIYPCSLLETAELVNYHQKGLWKPYDHQELLEVVTKTISLTPEYCRLTRIIRDIPGTDILVGNKFTNFRQMAEAELDKQGIIRKDIRSREIKNEQVALEDLHLEILEYESSIGTELFLQYITQKRQIAGFLRLSLPTLFLEKTRQIESSQKPVVNPFRHPFLEELSNAAVIREIHVYGQAVAIGDKMSGKAQHLGLGKLLIQEAATKSKSFGYQKLAVISAIGTREYYQKRGFQKEGLYQVMNLKDILNPELN